MQVFFTLVIRKLRLDVLISIFFLFFHILKKSFLYNVFTSLPSVNISMGKNT